MPIANNEMCRSRERMKEKDLKQNLCQNKKQQKQIITITNCLNIHKRTHTHTHTHTHLISMHLISKCFFLYPLCVLVCVCERACVYALTLSLSMLVQKINKKTNKTRFKSFKPTEKNFEQTKQRYVTHTQKRRRAEIA